MKPWMLTLFVVGLIAGCNSGGGSTVVGPGGVVRTSAGPGGKTTTTVNTADGKSVTSATDGTKTTLTSSDGSKMETGSDKAPNVGVEAYPGATVVPEGSVSSSSPQGSNLSARYTTPDAIAKVAEYYKGKLGRVDQVNSNDNGNAFSMLTKKDGKVTITVMVSRNKDETVTSVSVTRAEL